MPWACTVRKRGGVQKFMGHKVPLKSGMLICVPATSRPLIFVSLQLRDHPFDTLHSDFLSPFNSCAALRGFSLRGFWDVRGFPFCGGKNSLRLPLAVGKPRTSPNPLSATHH